MGLFWVDWGRAGAVLGRLRANWTDKGRDRKTGAVLVLNWGQARQIGSELKLGLSRGCAEHTESVVGILRLNRANWY